LAGGAVGGVYYSTDNGATWTTVPNTDMPIGALVSSVLYHNGYLYAGHNTGLARQQLAIASSTEAMEQSKLSIFPNPSRGLVNISWPGAEQLQAEVYNLNGQRVLQADLNTQDARLDARQLAKGVYVLRVTNPQNQQMQQQRLVIQ
jgi:xyloglucan-specific exo-beta-1,4-glucanase